MSELNSCPKCGSELPTNAPAGICPKCLLMAGMEEETPRPNSDPYAATILPEENESLPISESLAPYFPDLEIGELLGQGGMGAVYVARQTRLDRKVALKIIRPESADDPSFAERFNREARTLAKLNHPNIVAIYDFGDVVMADDEGESRTLYYFLMEYVDGANLRQVMASDESLADRALHIVSHICEALQFAHDEGIVHRDIKPENILIDRRGRVKIADFGLAKLRSEDRVEYTLTNPNQVMGTPRYMAPEQMQGSAAVDHRADIYSLGVVFYEMLTGELPLGRFDPPSKYAQYARASSIDQRWDEVVLRALEKEPQRRYQNASDVKTQVDRIQEHSDASKFDPRSDLTADPANSTMPHFGMLTFGGVMTGFGIFLLAFTLFAGAHLVFVWIGLGLALGGAGACLIGLMKDSRLPAELRPNSGGLLFGGIMMLVAVVIMLSRLVVGNGFANFHPDNAFVWISMGLLLGGGGCHFIAWEVERPNFESGPSQSNTGS